MGISSGQVRQDCKGVYVITRIENGFIHLLYSDGAACFYDDKKTAVLEQDLLIAEYKGWLLALYSDEFRNNKCNF